MAAGKEIRGKIKSFENTKKITKAMEMVSVSKMRKAQERRHSARPYAEKVRALAANLAQATPDYQHPFMLQNEATQAVGLIVVTSDKGLCGGLNTNLLRLVTARLKELDEHGIKVQAVAIGNKGLGFFNRIGVPVVSQLTQLGDKPHLDKLIGPAKVLFDAYTQGQLSKVYVCYTQFINTMRQEPIVQQLLPLAPDTLTGVSSASAAVPVVPVHEWDYLYEPDAPTVINELLVRYTEALVYQAVVENMASEHSARMVAMKSATDNAGNVIAELKLIYNRTRQAAITKELSEIVAGAAAV
jgi:F-type H+-transporting ATPase subunit gamma